MDTVDGHKLKRFATSLKYKNICVTSILAQYKKSQLIDVCQL